MNEPDVPDIIAGARQCSRAYAYTLMERALAERYPNASTQPEAEAQKAVAPFGWYGESRFDNAFTTNEDTSRRWHTNGYRLTPLYAAPITQAVKVPLTLEQLLAGWGHGDILASTSGPPHRGLKRELQTFTEGVRFAERAHGIYSEGERTSLTPAGGLAKAARVTVDRWKHANETEKHDECILEAFVTAGGMDDLQAALAAQHLKD